MVVENFEIVAVVLPVYLF